MPARAATKTRAGKKGASSASKQLPETSGRTAQGDERHQALIDAAFATLAERGFEGLRTREVAERAGVNIATLHYYFATKEALITGVAESLLQQFRREGEAMAGERPLARLQDELRTATLRIRKSSAVFTVLCELWLRAVRDPGIGRACRSIQSSWRSYLTELIRDGIADESLRADLDPGATADLVMCTLHGVMAQQGVSRDLSTLDRACSQLEQLLLRPPSLRRSRSSSTRPRSRSSN